MDESLISLSRLDWGLGNPNKTAALIALIMTAAWSLAFFRRWGFLAALFLFTTLGCCLVLTESRGGVISLIVGNLILLTWASRPFPRSRILAVALACLSLLILGAMTKSRERYTSVLPGEDRSIENRLLIWEQVPAMIRDSPEGWGLGNSGNAYMQWYQPIERSEGYRTLVNSHFTWLVELNWWGRITYIVYWVTVFILLWPQSGFRWFSIPFALWVVFGMSAFFSSVAESPIVWIIPILAFLIAMIVRIRLRFWPSESCWICGAGIAGGILVTLFAATLTKTSFKAYSPRPGVVQLGSDSPKLWILSPDRKILGAHYGHEIREAFSMDPTFQELGVGVTFNPKNIPQNRTVILSGQIILSMEQLKPSNLVFINPARPSTQDVVRFLGSIPRLTIVVGEFAQDKDFWVSLCKINPNWRVHVVRGSEEYIADWMHQIGDALED